MELNLTVDELRFLQVLLLGTCPESADPEQEILDLSTVVEDQLLVKLQDALDGCSVSASYARE
jgi:hypothetical protein